jgi:hypothetical protein
MSGRRGAAGDGTAKRSQQGGKSAEESHAAKYDCRMAAKSNQMT